MSTKIDIGSNIKKARIEKHLTQNQLAEMICVARQTISSYENGINEPSIDILELISEKLDKPLINLLYGESEEKKEPAHSNSPIILKSVLIILSVCGLLAAVEWLQSRLYSGTDTRLLLFFIRQLIIPALFGLTGYIVSKYITRSFRISWILPVSLIAVTTVLNIISYIACTSPSTEPFSFLWLYWEFYASSVIHLAVMLAGGLVLGISITNHKSPKIKDAE